MIVIKKKTVQVCGYCSRWVEGVGLVVDIPLDELEEIVATAQKNKERKLLGYCECCGVEIYEDDVHAKVDGVLYCDYCGGENGMSINELAEDW